MPASVDASCLRQGLMGLFQLIQLWPEGSHLPHPWTTTTSLWSFHTQFLSVLGFISPPPPTYSSLVGKNVTQGDLTKYHPFPSVFVFNVVLMTPLGDF